MAGGLAVWQQGPTMSENFDLAKLLESWPYDPDNNVRVVSAADGRQIMQVRLPLGIEQYEMDGRPDGQRPYGMESALEYQRQRVAQATAEGKKSSFKLNTNECAEVFNEGVLYYYRYLHCFQIKDWARTVRDTGRNLALFDLVRRYARREEDRIYLEQWRPYLIRMHAVSRAMIEWDTNGHERALRILREGIDQIEDLSAVDDPTFQFERKRSLEVLRDLAAEIEQTRPLPESQKIERELKRAVEAEEYERAAQLRDRLRELRPDAPPIERTGPPRA